MRIHFHFHHHHCVALTGQPRSHVAVQPSSVAPPLAPSSFFVCSQNLVSLDLDPQSPGWHTWVRKVSEHNTTTLHTFSIVFLCSSCWRCFALTPFARVLLFAFLQQRLRSELGYFLKLFCHCSAAAHHMIPCCLSDRQGAKVLHTFINTYTEIVADLHEIEESETLRLRHAAQNIALPHYGGIAVSRTSGGYEPENAGNPRTRRTSVFQIGLWHCYGSATW